MKKQKGITLIALIITIIILLILAGISIASLAGSGLFEKARLAKNNTLDAQYSENMILSDYENKINEITTNDKDNEEDFSKLYLYNNGNEYEDVTGGWDVGYLTGTTSSVGTATKYENYVEVKTWGYWCGFGMKTINNIDSSNYSKLCVDVYDTSWENVSGGYEQIAMTYGTIQKIFYTNDIQNKTYEIDISQMNDNSIVTVLVGNGANAKIRSVYLEK